MFLSGGLTGFGVSGGPLVLVGSPTLDLRGENNDGSTWTNVGSLGTTGNFTGTTSAGAIDSNFNGKHSVRFTAGSSNTMTSAATLSQVISAAAMTGLMVVRFATVNGDAPPITGANGAAVFSDAGGYHTLGTATDFQAENFDGAGDELATAVSANVTYGIQWQHGSSELRLLRSGASAATPVANNDTQVLTNTLQLGRQGASAKYFDGHLALFALWNTELSSGALASNRAAVAAFYGITW